jgi:hypothetical protein
LQRYSGSAIAVTGTDALKFLLPQEKGTFYRVIKVGVTKGALIRASIEGLKAATSAAMLILRQG